MSNQADGIFLIQGGTLVPMTQQPYAAEALLQEALAKFPAVLAGGTTTGRSGQLLLIKREKGIPSEDGGSQTWSVDHLFVDDQGVPVIVEVKRSSDTRIRREVVGQMLDYAANGVRYWPVAELRAAFHETALQDGANGDERLQEAIGEQDPEQFWQTVATNLDAGRVRMVFVADALPRELIRVIEFLNEQMSPAEVLGVELPQFVGEDETRVLVPRLIGRTSEAVQTKQSSTGTPWDRDGLLAGASAWSPQVRAVFDRLFRHVDERHGRFSWGKGKSPGVSGWYDLNGSSTAVWTGFTGTPPGSRPYVYVQLARVKHVIDTARFERFVAALERVPLLSDSMAQAKLSDYESKYPSVFVTDLEQQPEQIDLLFEALDIATPPARLNTTNVTQG